jgi:hypothetical protein
MATQSTNDDRSLVGRVLKWLGVAALVLTPLVGSGAWWSHRPTVSLSVTYVMVYTYGRDDGRIAPTRCAIIDAGLDGS